MTLSPKDRVLLAAVFFGTFILDQLSKSLALWFLPSSSATDPDWISWILVMNSGMMSGIFSDMPPLIRTVGISTIAGFVAFLYCMVQVLLPIRTMALRVGLTLFTAAALSNSCDRIFRGAVVDFIAVRSSSENLARVFNLADLLQWPALGLILYALFRDNVALWPVNNLRKNSLVDRRFQNRYAFVVVGVGAASALITGIFAYTFLRALLVETMGASKAFVSHTLMSFVVLFALIQVAFGLSAFYLSRRMSQKAAGPVHSFARFVTRCFERKPDSFETFRLRQDDDFRFLEDVARESSND